eukprot:Em0025g112a
MDGGAECKNKASNFDLPVASSKVQFRENLEPASVSSVSSTRAVDYNRSFIHDTDASGHWDWFRVIPDQRRRVRTCHLLRQSFTKLTGAEDLAIARALQSCRHCGRENEDVETSQGDNAVFASIVSSPLQISTPNEMHKLQLQDESIGPVYRAVLDRKTSPADVPKSWS